MIDEQTNGTLSLDCVDWKRHYILSKASLSQIMISFWNVSGIEAKDGNYYEKVLYEKLKPAVEKLIECYHDILCYENVIQKNIKFHNLIVNLPKNVTINQHEDGKIKMGDAKIGKLIAAAKQRINFIQIRDVPIMYANNESYLQEFNKMKEELNLLMETLCDFEKAFAEAVKLARNANRK